jgi:hypothetical protein
VNKEKCKAVKERHKAKDIRQKKSLTVKAMKNAPNRAHKKGWARRPGL